MPLLDSDQLCTSPLHGVRTKLRTPREVCPRPPTPYTVVALTDPSRISPNLLSVPNYALLGEPNAPQILSNKIILTPPSPGNQRAALWAEKPLTSPKWDATLSFRATGPERGGGRLHLWLVHDGLKTVGTSSIYTVSRFDGLVLVLDTFGGSAGMLRGYLNDGSIDYAAHHGVDGLAFGHCAFAYRNLGRPSDIHVQHDWHNFRVEVDGRLCFETSTIRIPTGYTFGVSAASADTPDSFEVFSLLVTTDTAEQGYPYPMDGDSPAPAAAQKPLTDAADADHAYLSPDRIPTASDLPSLAAAAIPAAQQFADLHYRLQSLSQHLSTFQGEFHAKQAQTLESVAAAVAAQKPSPPAEVKFPTDQLNALDRRMEALERALEAVKREAAQASRDGRAGTDMVHAVLAEQVKTLAEIRERAERTPGLATAVLVAVVSQAVVGALGVAWWRRREGRGMKKYL